MTLTYTIDGTGWATARLVTPDGCVEMTASCVHDSLGNLAGAVLDLLDGKPDSTVVFMDEPGEHQLCLRRSGDDVLLEVKWYDDWASWKVVPRSEPQTVLATTLPLAVFRRLVADALADVLEKLRVEGYKEKWVEHGFPLAAYERLRAS